MPTSPFTQITRDSSVWSPAVKALLTDGMLSLINKSPTLRAQLNKLGDEIRPDDNAAPKQIQLVDTSKADAATGSNYVARDNILSIHPDDMQFETIGVRLQLNHFSKDCENAVSGTFTDKIFSSPIDTGASSS